LEDRRLGYRRCGRRRVASAAAELALMLVVVRAAGTGHLL